MYYRDACGHDRDKKAHIYDYGNAFMNSSP